MLLCLKARLELAEDRPDLALRTLQTIYSMSRHVAEEPTLINALVGAALANLANQVLELALSHPKTPNLSGSLIVLPHPFIDMRRGFEGERLGLYGTFPGLQEIAGNPDAGPLNPELLAKMPLILSGLEDERGTLTRLLGSDLAFPVDRLINRVQTATNISKKHEIAKKSADRRGPACRQDREMASHSGRHDARRARIRPTL